MSSAITPICPKCHGEMHSYERNGVVVDQCDDCRGIFLDRGELEQLLESTSIPHSSEPERQRESNDGHHDGHDGHHDSHDEHFGKREGKRRQVSSLFQDLLGGGE